MKKFIVTFLSMILTASLLTGVIASFADGNAGQTVITGSSDILSDTWVGTDELGRVFPANQDVGGPRSGKYVGIFYFLFMSHTSPKIYDTTQTYLDGGVEALWEMAPLDGFHTWGRPYFNYYRTDLDEWIYRKHAQLLTDAGVDFVFLDTTNNGGLFENCWTLLLKTWKKVRDEGGNTPQVVFHNGDGQETLANHIKIIYEKAYSNPEYDDLWFRWEGKPLILGNLDKIFVSQELQDYFTFRRSWAFNDFTGDGILKWPWIAEYPQEPGRNANGEIEQIVVSAGFHSNSSRGRSYHDGFQPSRGVGDFGYGLSTTGEGIAFQEQWDRVFEIDPPLVMITGWNEFTFGRWPNAGVGQLISDSYTIIENDWQFNSNYVDAFSAEFSRDIEPISQLFRDNYYYQMVENIRRFKGVRSVEKGTGSTEIDMAGNFAEFDAIGPEYFDTKGDVAPRNSMLISGETVENTSGRNDIVRAKVSKTDKYTYFYAECASDIVTAPGTSNWMNLFIDSDQYYYSGWSGYDFVIGRETDGGKMSVEEFAEPAWKGYNKGWAEYSVAGNKLVVRVENSLIDLEERDNFDFKWADNSTVTGEVMEFMDLGDAAPNSRFNYRYVKEGGKISSRVRDTAVKAPLKGGNAGIPVPAIIAVSGAALLVAAAAAVLIINKKKGRNDNEKI
ncbi:MAG: hypothetical protein J6X34_02885 [Clostridia bacterium]|nr:hypothetical protein [Clostridia bacterium]